MLPPKGGGGRTDFQGIWALRLQITTTSLKFPKAVVLDAQKHKKRAQNQSAKECKRAKKGANERAQKSASAQNLQNNQVWNNQVAKTPFEAKNGLR